MDDAHIAIPSTFTENIFHKLNSLDQHLYFRWDLTSDTVTLQLPVPRKFRDLPQEVHQASTMLWTQELLHPDDRPLLHTYLHILFQEHTPTSDSIRKTSCKLRIRHHKNKYLWAEVHLLTYFQGTRPMVAFGNLHSIQAQKLWLHRLQQRADFDSLTGLLTKDAAVRHIEASLSMLSPEHDAAMMLLLDADGFKAINDNFGHLFGDGVLAKMGHTIKHHFRHSDIKGRIGGDEFVVLLPHTANLDGVRRHCADLIEAMHHDYCAEGRRLPFSISMGIALYPDHGLTYRELFKHADRALYEAKSRGKNQACVYQPKFYQEASSVANSRDPESTIDLQMRAFEDNMAEFVLQLFYETNSPEATINYAMSLLGRLYNLDRIVIARCDTKTGRYHDAFEWVGPDGGTLTGPEYTRMARERRRMILDEAHPTPYGVVSVCENTETLAPTHAKTAYFFGLKSYAYCIIPHGAETMGCIGVESTHPMTIRKELLRSLNLFSVLLGNILLPQDSSLALQKRLDLLADVLDHLPTPCYVLDNATKEVVYANAPSRASGNYNPDAPGQRKALLHEHTKDGHDLLLVTKNDEALSYL
ncbi:GGDEF domain-containing protein [Selenomonas sp.]|uniref:GGDEF domain-containing protein n=1 Tax=Selenomonas sp. TaxID=2053611 RepID=UPI002A81E468|nr:GGDEF domain-containing protein [Selenomonas sp.]MDY4416631.1 GGDEF domain-containing protein [Selenomonas sp.]